MEFAEQATDVIYHFWPPNDDQRFMEKFHRHLEDGFIATLPPDARVKAEFTTVEEAAVTNIVRAREAQGTGLVVPRETYYIRVFGGTELPFYESYLKNKVFENIERAIRES